MSADMQPMRLDHSRDLTDQPNDAGPGELRPVFRFDGATYGAMVESAAGALGLGKQFARRFLRMRTLPVPYTTDVATIDGQTAANQGVSRHCYDSFCCTECGMPIADKADTVGWIFEGTTVDGHSRLGGGLMCTGCVHAVCKFCPHMWVAVRQDPPLFVLRQVCSADDYEYIAVGSRLQAVESAPTFTFDEFAAYRANLLRTQRSS
jgi:hypothetical protein